MKVEPSRPVPSGRMDHDAATPSQMRRSGVAKVLVIRSHDRWYHGIDQATPLRLQIDEDGVEIFRHDG